MLAYRNGSAKGTNKLPRPAAAIAGAILRMFDGFDLVEPGLTALTQRRGDELDEKLDAAGQWWLGGVGRKN